VGVHWIVYSDRHLVSKDVPEGFNWHLYALYIGMPPDKGHECSKQ